MKKIIATALLLTLALSVAACGGKDDKDGATTTAGTTATTTAGTTATTEAPDVDVMSYEEYMAAEDGATVCVEAYVQATQSWWDNKITIYAQSEEGGYFFYKMACTEDEAALLVPGTKICATGPKTTWAGEVEIMEGSFVIIEDDTWTAEAMDATALLGSDTLIENQNKKVAFKGLTVEAANDDGAAFLYNWDGSGTEGSDSDLYFNASIGGATYTFVVEYYLTGADSDVYKAVQALKVGDVIDMEGFLYWYEGAQPHITSVTAAE